MTQTIEYTVLNYVALIAGSIATVLWVGCISAVVLDKLRPNRHRNIQKAVTALLGTITTVTAVTAFFSYGAVQVRQQLRAHLPGAIIHSSNTSNADGTLIYQGRTYLYQATEISSGMRPVIAITIAPEPTQ